MAPFKFRLGRSRYHPISSPEARSYVTTHLKQMQDPELTKQIDGVPRFMQPMLERDHTLFAVERKDQSIGGVHTFVYVPKAGAVDKNRERVLINLHGGGFSGCWPGCAEIRVDSDFRVDANQGYQRGLSRGTGVQVSRSQ